MRGWRSAIVAVVGAAALLAIWAPAASATFHLMQIREVYPGSVATPGSEYVELQMWAEGQNHVGGHVLRSYDATGTVTGIDTFPADVAHGANQSTMVLATPEAESQFGLISDAPLVPSGELDPSGGAVCWENLDCVSWGGFSGSLPSPAGSPAAPGGIPDGMALRRSIAPGCPTLLEPGDDHDNSAADFSVVFPGPRPNSVPPSEHACGAGVAAPSQPGGGRRRRCSVGSRRSDRVTAPRPSASPRTMQARASNAQSTPTPFVPVARPSRRTGSPSAATSSECAPATRRDLTLRLPPTPSGYCVNAANGR